jgi:hypothetical protein
VVAALVVENRETGRITVAQFPDRPLFEIGGESLIGSAADGSTTPHRRSGSERGAQNDTARQPVATVQTRLWRVDVRFLEGQGCDQGVCP